MALASRVLNFSSAWARGPGALSGCSGSSSSVKAVAANSSGKTVAEIRSDFDKYANIDAFEDVKATDLDISKEGSDVVVAFAYEKRVHLFYNISLLIEFAGSSSGRER